MRTIDDILATPDPIPLHALPNGLMTRVQSALDDRDAEIERLRAALREIRREARTVGYDYGNDKIVSIVDTALAETDPAIPFREGDGGADKVALCEECGIYPADLPSRLCPGCEAHRDHTG